jgi:hypothetical protein
MTRVDGVSTTAVPFEIIALDASTLPLNNLTNLYGSISRTSDGAYWDFASSAFSLTPSISQYALSFTSTVDGLYQIPSGWVPPDGIATTYALNVTQTSPFSVAGLPTSTFVITSLAPSGASLGTSLVDSLVTMVDDLRYTLNSDMGVRQFRVWTIRRKWSGQYVGEGALAVTQVTEIIPPPRVVLTDTHNLTEGGLQETGTAELHEVSLAASEADLLGFPVAANEEFFYVLRDALGQGVSTRLYIPQDHPWPDREKEIGWIVKLRRVDLPPNVVS